MVDHQTAVDTYHIVALVLGIVAALFVVLDIILNLNDVYEDNLNYIIHDLVYGKYYFIPFVAGFILGHLFLGAVVPWVNGLWGLVPVLLVALVLFFVGRRNPLKEEKVATVICLLVVGAILGHFMWSMNGKIPPPDDSGICLVWKP